MKRYLQSGDLICTKNDKIYTVEYFSKRTKEIFTVEKNHYGNSFIIPLDQIYGAMKK